MQDRGCYPAQIRKIKLKRVPGYTSILGPCRSGSRDLMTKNCKTLPLNNCFSSKLQYIYPNAAIKDVQITREASRPQKEHPAFLNNSLLIFPPWIQIRIRLTDHISMDLCGSGSRATILLSVLFVIYLIAGKQLEEGEDTKEHIYQI